MVVGATSRPCCRWYPCCPTMPVLPDVAVPPRTPGARGADATSTRWTTRAPWPDGALLAPGCSCATTIPMASGGPRGGEDGPAGEVAQPGLWLCLCSGVCSAGCAADDMRLRGPLFGGTPPSHHAQIDTVAGPAVGPPVTFVSRRTRRAIGGPRYDRPRRPEGRAGKGRRWPRSTRCEDRSTEASWAAP